MKKVLSWLLALTLLLSLSTFAFAAGEAEHKDIELVSAVDANGKDVSDSVKLTTFANRASLSAADYDAYNKAIASMISGFEDAVRNDPRMKTDADNVLVAIYDTTFISVNAPEGTEFPITLELTAPDSYKASMMYAQDAWGVINSELKNKNVLINISEGGVIAETELITSKNPDEEEKEADDKDFHPSVENDAHPGLKSAINHDGTDISDALTVVVYHRAAMLPKVHQDVFSLAYKDLYDNFDEIVKNDAKLSALAGDKEVAVSDAFFISELDSSDTYNLKIELELTNYGNAEDDDFVSLMEYDNGVWKAIDSTEVDGVLMATVDHIGPFAIVVFAAE